jgi:hypothetical protein
MPRTRSPPSPYPRPAPQGGHAYVPATPLPRSRATARHRLRRVRPARRLRRQAYPPARGRLGGRWSSAYAPARCYPAGRQARLTAIWRAQVFRSRQALLPWDQQRPSISTTSTSPVAGSQPAVPVGHSRPEVHHRSDAGQRPARGSASVCCPPTNSRSCRRQSPPLHRAFYPRRRPPLAAAGPRLRHRPSTTVGPSAAACGPPLLATDLSTGSCLQPHGGPQHPSHAGMSGGGGNRRGVRY